MISGCRKDTYQVQEEEEVSKTLQIHAWMVVASRSHSRQL
jgi:hypothetical protein